MLVLKRKEGQWIEITHKSGDLIRVRVNDICGDFPGRVNLVFDDAPRNFEVHRPERGRWLDEDARAALARHGQPTAEGPGSPERPTGSDPVSFASGEQRSPGSQGERNAGHFEHFN